MIFIVIMLFITSGTMEAGITSTSFEASFDSYDDCMKVSTLAAQELHSTYTGNGARVECILKDSASFAQGGGE